MTKKILAFSVLLLSAFSLSVAQEISMSEAIPVAAASFGYTRPRIVLTKDNKPYVIWGNASKQIVYGARWNGTGFDMPMRLSNTGIKPFIFDWASTEIAARDNMVYVAFKTDPAETGKVYIVKSTDGGMTFSDTVRVENLGGDLSRFPSVAVDGMGNPVITFMRFGPAFSKPDYVVARSMDGGKTFMPDVAAAEPAPGEACDCCPAAMIADGSRQALLFRNNNMNIRNIWAAISTDGGSKFSTLKEIDTTNWKISGCPSTGPDGIFSGDNIAYTWMSQSSVYIGSADLSGNISLIKKMNDIPTGSQNYPRIDGAGDTLATVWRQYENARNTILISHSTSGANGIGTQIDTVAISNTVLDNPDIAYANGAYHVVYQDNTTKQVKYRKVTLLKGQTSVQESIETLPSIAVYPNPATGDVIIKTGSETTIGNTVIVRTIFGQNIWKGSMSNSQVIIPSGTLAPGTYILEITSLKGKSFKKLVIL